MTIYSQVFVQNNSTKEYFDIIHEAIRQKRQKTKRNSKNFIYYEAHHILPKCIFPELSKEKTNIVLLTAKEHYRCHELLIEMTTGNTHHKMVHAFWSMATRKTNNMDRVKISKDDYHDLRNKFSLSRK